VKKRISFAEQDAIRDEMFSRYRILRYCMDQTGMGEKPVEDAQRKYGATRVEGVLFTSANKLHLATVGKECFEDRRIRIPMGDQPMRSDLHALKKIPSATGGAPRFDADANENGHADRAWACFLACHAADRPFVHMEYEGVPGRRAPAPGSSPLDFEDEPASQSRRSGFL
jgi:phage FluMu gp28-like protein